MGFPPRDIPIGAPWWVGSIINETHQLIQMATNKSTKRPHLESSDSEPEMIYENTSTFIIIHSIEETRVTKISPLKIEQILSKEIKLTIIKKLTNRTILIEVKNKTQMKEILKWETFNNIKIETSIHQTLNSSKGVVKSSELCVHLMK